MPDLRVESVLVSAGRPHDPGGPVNPPIVLTAPYRNGPHGNDYARSLVSPTVRELESALGALDGGTAIAFGSGMAAVAAVADTLPVGAIVVAPGDGYSGTLTTFDEAERTGRLRVRRVDIADTDQTVAALDGAALLWLETITNPLMHVPDLPALVEAAHASGVVVAVDATWSTPLNVRPLDLGVDVVMHSVTKYLGGHSDLLMGALVTGAADRAEQWQARRTLAGSGPGALETFLALRGLRTLAVRFERAQANAGEIARRLDGHPQVALVRYPGLPHDAGHARIARDHHGFGAMIGFEVRGDAAAADRVAARTQLITNATSLGGVESLIERRAQHAVDAGFGTPANLLRLSVGIEHVEDLWADLDQALSD